MKVTISHQEAMDIIKQSIKTKFPDAKNINLIVHRGYADHPCVLPEPDSIKVEFDVFTGTGTSGSLFTPGVRSGLPIT